MARERRVYERRFILKSQVIRYGAPKRERRTEGLVCFVGLRHGDGGARLILNGRGQWRRRTRDKSRSSKKARSREGRRVFATTLLIANERGVFEAEVPPRLALYSSPIQLSIPFIQSGLTWSRLAI